MMKTHMNALGQIAWRVPERLLARIEELHLPRDYSPAKTRTGTVEVSEGYWLLAAWLGFRFEMRHAITMQGHGTDRMPTDEEFEALTSDQVDAYAVSYINDAVKHRLFVDLDDIDRGRHSVLYPIIRNPVLDAAIAVNKARGIKP